MPGGGDAADDVKRRGRLGSDGVGGAERGEKAATVWRSGSGSGQYWRRPPGSLGLRVDAGPRLARKDCGRLGLLLIRPLCGRHVQL